MVNQRCEATIIAVSHRTIFPHVRRSDDLRLFRLLTDDVRMLFFVRKKEKAGYGMSLIHII